MAKLARIHHAKTPIRRHFIAEWAESRNLRQVDIAEALEVEKSQVSRWFSGQMPQPAWQERLAALFEIEPEALLRHPDHDWLARFFLERDQAERDRIKRAIELSFPLKSVG